MISPLAELPARSRAFIAVRPDQETALAVAGFVKELWPLKADVSWVKPANLHLTLRFLGDQVQASRLAVLSEALTEAALRCAPFFATVAGVGAFPRISRPRVIWVKFESPALTQLAQQAEQCALAAGFAPMTRAFAPHLTIGRVRSLRGFGPTAGALVQAQAREFGRSPVDAMTLYRSELSASGPSYHEVLTVKLGAVGRR